MLSVGFWVWSDLRSFRQLQGILHVNTQIPYHAVDLGMAEKDLNRA
jgi:hypothetical protein